MLTKIYRKIIPSYIRQRLYNIFLGDLLSIVRCHGEWLKWRWCGLFYYVISPKSEKAQAFKAWGRTSPSPYPYLWKKEYDLHKYEVYVDAENALPYVMHKGKKLYFKRDMVSMVESAYRSLLIEQDKRSAHRYVDSYEDLKGKILLDIGAAEAIFTLDTIDYIDHAYLFECDDAWIEALNATFAPWKNKITIVRKYVSDADDENNMTLDTFFKDKENSKLFLKMDIEGYERKALKGAMNLLSSSDNISGSVCVYHQHDDERVIGNILYQVGLKTEIQSGYLYFEREMRRAIMRFGS